MKIIGELQELFMTIWATAAIYNALLLWIDGAFNKVLSIISVVAIMLVFVCIAAKKLISLFSNVKNWFLNASGW